MQKTRTLRIPTLATLTVLVTTALAGPASSEPTHGDGFLIIQDPEDTVGLKLNCPESRGRGLEHILKSSAPFVETTSAFPLNDEDPEDAATDFATQFCAEPRGDQSPPDESCVEGTCESPQPPAPPRPRPPTPDVPTQFGTAFEAVAENATTAPATSTHDWDDDGVPDLLDAVNLPSESQEMTASQDLLSLPDGLPDGGFTLLVEPSHDEAYVVLGGAIPPTEEVLGGAAALDRIAEDNGNRIRQSLAMVIHDGMQVHFRGVVPEIPQDVALDDWTGGPTAADGSWLLVRTDPDRRLQLTLAGDLVNVAVRAASQFSPDEEIDYRWEYLNLHSGDNLCYDPTTATNLTSCQGTRWPGWIRAYSGQAAYSLESTWLALEQDKLTLTSPVPPVLPVEVPSEPSSQPARLTLPLPPPVETLDVFDEASPWKTLGSSSQALDAGVGIDYHPLPLDAGDTPLVAQAPGKDTVASTLVDGDVRRFHFQGAVFQMPATLRDLGHVKLGITPVDGNHSARDFRIDGAALDALLGPEAAGALQARIDERHRDGFTFDVLDDDGDGQEDIHIHVPHFSTTWIEVYRDDSHVSFRDIEMTSATTGWLSGAYGAVYRYQTGHLTEVTIPDVAYRRTVGIHVVSDSNFWVVGRSDYTNDGPYIAHYVGGSWFVDFFPPEYRKEDLFTVWMNDDQSLGYAGGTNGLWVKYTPSTGWNVQSVPMGCTIRDIAFTNAGTGFVGVWAGDGAFSGSGQHHDCMRAGSLDSAMVHFDGTTFSSASGTDVELVLDVEEEDRKWAVGTQPGTYEGSRGGDHDSNPDGIGLHEWDGSKWRQVNTGKAPIGFVNASTVVKVPGADRYLFSAHDGYNAYLFEDDNGAWKQVALPYDITFADIDLVDGHLGYGISGGVIFQYEANTPPVAAGSITPSSGTTKTSFSGSGAGSSDPDGDSISHRWYWGDGSFSSSGSMASHRFDDVGSFAVTHRVTDELGAFDEQTFTVDVAATVLNLGGSQSESFTSNRIYETHHYKIPAASSDRYIELELDGPWYLSHLKASLESPVEDDGSWPTQNDYTTDYHEYGWDPTLAGKVPGGQALYVAVHNPRAHWVNEFDMSYTVSAVELPAPKDPTTDAVWSPQNGEYGVSFSAQAPHSGDRDTQLVVDWGDASAEERYEKGGFTAPGTTHYLHHDYASPGTYTIKLKTVDDAAQESAWITRSVAVLWPPEGQATGATDVTAVSAKLHGSLDEMGGDSSVQIRYQVYNDGTLVDSSNWMTRSSTGALPSYTVSGLTSGTSYTYRLALINDVSFQGSDASAFETVADLTSVPSITSSNTTANLGQSVSLSFQSSQSNANDVAYWVRWGDGTGEERFPASGWVPWDQVVTATHTYGFADAYDLEVRLQDESLARSEKTTRSADVLGDSPLASLALDSFLNDVEITAQAGQVALNPGTDMRIAYYDPVADAWTASSWFLDVGEGDVYSWRTGTLDRSRTYEARVEFQNDDGSQWVQGDSLLRFQTNRAPSLTPVDTPATVSPDGLVTFAVMYRDAEGDPPVDDLEDPRPPVLEVNGESYAMHAPAGGSTAYKSGVTYTYSLRAAELGEGLGHAPLYSARDEYQDAANARGASVFVNERSVMALDFEDEPVGSAPGSLARSSGLRNYWHVVDTDASSMPDRVAVGRHGNALWFAHPTRGTYEDPNGGTPKGSLTTKRIDLGVVTDPVLSFSSYYETEDLGTSKDKKLVEVRSRTGSSWSSWQTIHEVQGYEGGYGAWRSQHVDLSSYAGDVVQVRFRFDAVDQHHNRFLGWLVDDVVVGQDQDGDTLPDTLEDRRHDARISRQPIAAEVADGGDGQSHVRRLVRTQADHLVMEALVSHPDPSDLRLWVGVEPRDASGQAREVLLYDQGTTGNHCPTTFWNPSFLLWDVPSRAAVEETSDGISLLADLWRCDQSWDLLGAEAFSESRDWYVRVEDTSSDEQVAWIESLRIVSEGKTSRTAQDTDWDTVPDGVEVDGLLDPIGIDGDGDSISQARDPDDNTPNWAPATVVGSSDWTNHVDWKFDDVKAPIVSVEFLATDSSGNNRRHLAATGLGGAAWRVDVPSELPEVFVAEWQDAYGTTGRVRVEMASDAIEYRPAQMAWECWDTSTGQQTSAVDDVLGSEFMMVAAPVVVVDPTFATKVALGIVVVGAVAYGAYTSYDAGGDLVRHQEFRVPSSSHLTSAVNAATGIEISVATGVGALTIGEYEDVIENGKKIEFPDASGATRWIREYGGRLYVLVTHGEGKVHEVEDAWYWRLPPFYDWDSTLLFPGLILFTEKQVSTFIVDKVWGEFENRHYTRNARKVPTESVEQMRFEAQGTGAEIAESFSEVDVPKSWMDALEASYAASALHKLLFNQSAHDFTVGSVSLKHATSEARRDAPSFETRLNWYWDGGMSAQDCDTTSVPDVRRCNEFFLRGAVAFSDYVTGGEDLLESMDLRWPPSGSPSTSKYEDVVSSKGLVHAVQLEKASEEISGKTPLDWMMTVLDEFVGTQDFSAYDADVRVAYDWVVLDKSDELKVRMDFQDPSP